MLLGTSGGLVVAIRIFLGLSALVWLPYGLLCFFDPAFLEGAAGVSYGSATGSTEIRAMYGGLQAAIGVLALWGALRPAASRYALVTIAALCAGLALARALGALLDGGFSAYTASGLGFEIASVTAAAWLLRRPAPLPA